MPVKEAEATNSLVDQGINVITCHVDSPKVVMETCERRGIFCSGYHASQAVLAPKGYLTGAEWNWEGVYTDFVKRFQAGEKLPNLTRGGLKEGMVQNLSLRGSSRRGGAAAGRGRAGAVDGRNLCDLQRPTAIQYRDHSHSSRRAAGPDRSEPGKYGLAR